MIYTQLFNTYRKKDLITVAVIGAGHFGKAIVTQQSHTPHLRVSIVADKNLKAAKDALLDAGLPEDSIAPASDAGEAQRLISAGKHVYTDAPMMIAEVSAIDVVAEATGVPEAGAQHCKAAVEAGKHVTAISKEMDVVVGPVLRRLAIDHGVTYSPVDGDQPALIMGMTEWAKAIGLTVVSVGKARDAHFVLDEEKRTISLAHDGRISRHEDTAVSLAEDSLKYFEMIPDSPDAAEAYVSRRAEAVRTLPTFGDYDLCELTMVANATGMKPSVPETTRAVLRITELPVVFCSKKNNGIYEEEGIVDLHTNLHRYDESGMGGGVHMVVRCDNAYSNFILTTMGQHINYDASTAVIYRPYHLCGVEASLSALCQGLLGIDTGTLDYFPAYDLIKQATRDIRKGEIIGDDHDEKITGLILPAGGRGRGKPIPGHMANGNAASRDIKKGEIITYDMIVEPVDSVLWDLRARQDDLFGIE